MSCEKPFRIYEVDEAGNSFPTDKIIKIKVKVDGNFLIIDKIFAMYKFSQYREYYIVNYIDNYTFDVVYKTSVEASLTWILKQEEN